MIEILFDFIYLYGNTKHFMGYLYSNKVILSFSKDTLLCFLEHKKSVSKRIGNCAVITAPKASFPDAQTAQKKNGNKSVYKSEP